MCTEALILVIKHDVELRHGGFDLDTFQTLQEKRKRSHSGANIRAPEPRIEWVRKKIVPAKYMSIAMESFAEVKKCHQWKVCEDQTCGQVSTTLISPSNSAGTPVSMQTANSGS